MHNRKGFTLIELSIVLVIIGLLVGGVLVGRDLIYVASIRKMGTELQQITTAINTFRIKFDCLPGDCANATTFFGVNSGGCPAGGGSTGTCDGDGDNFINGYNTFGNLENVYAMQQLSLSGLYSWNFDASRIKGGPTWLPLVVGKNLPSSSLNPLIGYNLFSVRVIGVAKPFKKTIEIGATGNPNVDVLSGAGLTGPQANSLDIKFDDGNPQSGKIYAVSGGSTISTLTTVNTQASAVNPNTTCVSSGSYLTSDASGCTIEYTPDVP